MPMPRWLARFNRGTFNRLELKRGERPVLIHTGRRSGRTFHTPLDAHPVDGAFIFVVTYGLESDWVQNVLAAGTARLRVRDDEYALHHPQVLTGTEAAELLPASARRVTRLLRIDHVLWMDIAS